MIEMFLISLEKYNTLWILIEVLLISIHNICFHGEITGLDKSRYPVNIFLISPRKHVVGTH